MPSIFCDFKNGIGVFGLVCFWLGGSFVFVLLFVFFWFFLIMTVEILVKKIAIQ